MGISTVIAVSGILLARSLYAAGPERAHLLAARFSVLYKMLWNKWYLDEIYQMLLVNPIYIASRDFLWKVVDIVIIDGIVNGSARTVAASASILRRLQTGIAQNYALLMMAGIVVLIVIVLYPFFS
jgi:NADH-quinone oxidoreductase subunit L